MTACQIPHVPPPRIQVSISQVGKQKPREHGGGVILGKKSDMCSVGLVDSQDLISCALVLPTEVISDSGDSHLKKL